MRLDDNEKIKDMSRQLNIIFSTVPVPLYWSLFLSTLRPNGTMCFLGNVREPFSISLTELQEKQISITGCRIGSRKMIEEMLEFAVMNGIHVKTQIMPMEEVNDAISQLRKNKARYRFVLKN